MLMTPVLLKSFPVGRGGAGRGCRVGDLINGSAVRITEVESSIIERTQRQGHGLNFGARPDARAAENSVEGDGPARAIRREDKPVDVGREAGSVRHIYDLLAERVGCGGRR